MLARFECVKRDFRMRWGTGTLPLPTYLNTFIVLNPECSGFTNLSFLRSGFDFFSTGKTWRRQSTVFLAKMKRSGFGPHYPIKQEEHILPFCRLLLLCGSVFRF